MKELDLEKMKAAGVCVHGNFQSTCAACIKEKEGRGLEISPSSMEADRSKEILAELERDRERENANTKASLEVIRRLRASFASPDFSRLSKEERLKVIVEKMHELWPENDGRGAITSFRLNAIDASMGDSVLRLAPMTANATYGYDLKGRGVIRLGLRQLLEAPPDALAATMDKNDLYIVHEMEHMVAMGDEDLSDGEDEAQRFAYLSHPGEMRAIAKMFGYYYARQTNEEFSGERMLTFMQQLSSSNVANEYYGHYARANDTAKRAVADRMTEITKWYIQHFREQEF